MGKRLTENTAMLSVGIRGRVMYEQVFDGGGRLNVVKAGPSIGHPQLFSATYPSMGVMAVRPLRSRLSISCYNKNENNGE